MDLVNKYRPTRLSQVIGQAAAVSTIRGVMRCREEVNPVTLFCGPHSTGKTTLAWLLALYANCKTPLEDGAACRKCESCVNIIAAIKNGTDGRSVIEKPVSERGIDAIRSLEQQARYRCQDRYRWYIIDEAHNLTKQAFDAALRLFEKPPPQARFVLCTTAPETLPHTIMSRNFVFTLQRIPPEVTAKKLLSPICRAEKFDVDRATLLKIAEKVNGHPRDALNLLAQWVAAAAGGLTPEDAPHLLQTLDAATPYEAIEQYTKAILHQRPGAALFAAQHASSHEYFVGQVLVLLREVLYRWISAERLADARYDMAVTRLAPPRPQSSKRAQIAMGKVLQIYVEAQDRIKQYRCDNRAVLDAAAIEAIALVQKAW